MNNKKIIRYSRNYDDYMTITSNDTMTLYTLYKNNKEVKASFNKDAFIEYLKGYKIPKKYIMEVKNYE